MEKAELSRQSTYHGSKPDATARHLATASASVVQAGGSAKTLQPRASSHRGRGRRRGGGGGGGRGRGGYTSVSVVDGGEGVSVRECEEEIKDECYLGLIDTPVSLFLLYGYATESKMMITTLNRVVFAIYAEQTQRVVEVVTTDFLTPLPNESTR